MDYLRLQSAFKFVAIQDLVMTAANLCLEAVLSAVFTANRKYQ